MCDHVGIRICLDNKAVYVQRRKLIQFYQCTCFFDTPCYIDFILIQMELFKDIKPF